MGGKSNMIELIKQEPRDDGRDMIIPFSVTLKDGWRERPYSRRLPRGRFHYEPKASGAARHDIRAAARAGQAESARG